MIIDSRTLPLFLISLFSFVAGYGQQVNLKNNFDSPPRKYTEIVFGGPIGYASIGLGRQFPFKNNKASFRPSVSYIQGVYYASDDTPPYGITINGDILMTPNPFKNSIDISFGLGLTVLNFSDDYDLPRILPRFNLQYRFQRNHAFARIGFGFPELLNVSFGF